MRAQRREAAWDAYQAGRADEASANFQASLPTGTNLNLQLRRCVIDEEKLLTQSYFDRPTDKSLASFFAPQAMRYLQEAGEHTFVAPTATWPQLVHWMDPDIGRPIVHAVYGPTELLLYGARFLILSFDWNAGTFNYVDYTSILKATGLSGDRFFETCMLAGFEGQPSMVIPNASSPPLSGSTSAVFQSFLDARAPSASDIATLLGGPESAKVLTFNRAVANVRLNLIIDLKSDTRPFQREYIVHTSLAASPVLDIKLPEAVYWMLSTGAISSQVINSYLSGAIIETTPLVDSPEYHRLLNDLLPMRARSIAFFAQTFPASNRAVSNYRWYEPTNPAPVSHANFKSFAKSVSSRTLVSHAELEDEASRRGLIPESALNVPGEVQSIILENLSIPFLLSTLENNKNGATAPAPIRFQLNPAQVLQASAVALALETYQYVGMSRSISDLGNALKIVAPQHASEAFIFLELLRSAHLHGEPIHPSSSAADNDPELSLISRVFSLISMNLTEKWAGPIDRELMAFNSIVRAVHRTARNIVEMSLLAITQAGRTCPAGEYTTIARGLPFFQEANTALGVVVSSFLLEDYADFKSRFTKIATLKEDLLRGYAFWKDLQQVVTALGNSKTPSVKTYLTPEFVTLFNSASQRLETAFATLE